MRLFPRPAASLVALAACQDLESAVGLLRIARRRLDAALTGFELVERFAMALVARHFPHLRQPLPGAPWTVLLELAAGSDDAARQLFEAVLGEALQATPVTDSAIAANTVLATWDTVTRRFDSPQALSSSMMS